MKNTKRTLTVLLPVLTAMHGGLVFAQAGGVEGKADLKAVVTLETKFDDNAERVSDDAGSQLTEQQNRASVSLLGDYSGNLTQWSLNYQVAEDFYTRNTQDDANTTVGQSQLNIGNEKTFYGLQIEHTARQTLTDPVADNIIENTRKQNSVFVRPSLKTRGDKVDSFILQGLFNRVNYENGTNDDTRSYGAELIWNHRLHSSRNIDVSFQSRSTDFLSSDDADYDYRRLAVGFASATRYLDYYLQVGANEIETKAGEEQGGLFYSANVNADLFGTTFTAQTSKEYSDSSVNVGISSEASSISVSGGADLQDQVEIETQSFSWDSGSLCARCTLSLNYSVQEIAYANLSDEDLTTRISSVQFSYRINKQLSALTSYSEQDSDYKNDLTPQDATSKSFRLAFDYTFSPMASTQVFWKEADRETDTNPYDSSVWGVQLSIEFD